MQNACQAQLLAEAAGTTKPVPHDVAKHIAGQVGGPYGDFGFQPYFDLIAREEPDLFD